MQDKNLYNDKEIEKKEEQTRTEANEDIIDDGVVYVVNEDGTPFDTSDRTYVAVEGLEEALEAEDNEKENKEEE